MFSFEYVLDVVDKAFAKAAVTSGQALRDDRKVRKAASEAHDALPFPIRLAIRCTVGKPGFERFVLHLRDVMLRDGARALDSLDRNSLADIYAKAPHFIRDYVAAPFAVPVAPQAPVPPLAPSPLPIAHDTAPAPASTSACWHAIRGSRQDGPFSDVEFLCLVEEGGLLPTDLVWREGFEEWITLAELPALVAARHLGRQFLQELDRTAMEPA